MTKIQLKNISVKKKDKFILDKANLTISNNQIILIQGDSGAGKSTLLKSILYFEDIHSGEILIDNTNVDSTNISEYRQHFSYISQKLPYFQGGVSEFLYLPTKFLANKNLDISKKTLQLFMHTLRLDEEILDKQYNNLSDGEKQRICILQSLLLGKKFIILDEVTSNLDKLNKQRVVKLFKDLKVTIITVSHDSCWDNAFTEKLIMENGKIIEVIKR